jgi:hypothetical protein
MPEATELWTLAKAAAKVGMSYGRIDSRVKSGHIPHVQLASGQYVVLLQDVQNYIDNPMPRGRKPQKKD